MLFGLVSNILCQLVFGVSEWYSLCVLLRFINGSTNCFLPITKCFVRECTDVSNQSRLFSLREVGFSVGAMVAPLLGSMLARPADQKWLADTFLASQFFAEYPYALICFTVSFIDAICIVVIVIFMKETLQKKNEKIEIEMEEIGTESISIDDLPQIVEGEANGDETKHELLTENDKEMDTPEEISPLQRFLVRFSFLDRATMLSILIYMVLSFGNIMVIQTIPVWASQPIERHGLSFEERELGILTSISAVSAIIFQIFIFSPIDSFFGCIVSLRHSLGS